MWEFSLSRALGLMIETMPFILMRLGIYVGGAIGALAAIALGAGAGELIGAVTEDASSFAPWGAAFALLAASVAAYRLGRQQLYGLRAAHLSVLVELAQGRTPPMGQAQIDHGYAIAATCLGEHDALSALDRRISGVTAAILKMIGGVTAFVPLPWIEGLVSAINLLIRWSMRYADELVLAYAVKVRVANPWRSARQGLVFYAQNSKRLIRNALLLTVLHLGLPLIVFLAMSAPMYGLFSLFPGHLSGWSFIGALLFAYAIKAALIEPFALACLMEIYFRMVDRQVPDPEWDRALTEGSADFREIRERALGGALF